MPRKPRAPKRRRYKDTLAENQRFHLLTGMNYPFLEGPEYEDPDFPFESEAHRRRLWNQHKKEIMASIGDTSIDHAFQIQLATRPEAWWMFEAIPQYGMRRLIEGSSSWFCGHIWFGSWSAHSGGHPIVESQFEYLKRNSLLLDGEEEKVEEAEKKRRVTRAK